ncbi:hypothetical protein BD779DRAFT_1611503 [Infundibulicybe gibba]|nr:hypothetical protein BD779DRAFT_1611503 [Infundibulicybe gibba]
MPDWKSADEIAKDASAFIKFMHALLGIYIYEWFLSLDFDWDFISGKKKFRWPMIFYFANRYLLFFAMIGMEVNCQALFTFNQLAGDAAVGLASINLSIRTMAVWSQNRYIIALLVLIILGHWSLILQGVLLNAIWVPGTGCVITKTNNTVLAATFIYSMCFDLVVLLLNAYKLLGINASHHQGLGSSRLAKMIFEDGLIFFFIAFLANLVATVFMLLNLNQIMSVIFNVPAAVASTIVACRAVRRLTNFHSKGQGIYAPSSSHSAQFGPPTATRALAQIKNARRSGVHVQMETFTRAEDDVVRDIEEKRYQGRTNQRTVTLPGSPSDTDGELDIEAKGAAL